MLLRESRSILSCGNKSILLSYLGFIKSGWPQVCSRDTKHFRFFSALWWSSGFSYPRPDCLITAAPSPLLLSSQLVQRRPVLVHFRSSFQEGSSYAVHSFLKVFQYCSIFFLKQLLLIINAKQFVNTAGPIKIWEIKYWISKWKSKKEIRSANHAVTNRNCISYYCDIDNMHSLNLYKLSYLSLAVYMYLILLFINISFLLYLSPPSLNVFIFFYKKIH